MQPDNGVNETSSDLVALSDQQYANYIAHPEVFAANTVYFDFDSPAVKTGEQSKAASVADYLKGNPSNVVRIEGNCDERGTEEDNRSLGERRALALRQELVRLGIEPVRVVTLSYGEDRPADSAQTPAAWAKNRRGEFVLLTPPN